MKLFHSAMLVISAGSLMSVFGCGLPGQNPPQLVLQETPVPKVESWVHKKPQKKSCLDPGKKEYEVKELEADRDCKDEYIQKLEYRHQTLSKVVKEIEGK